MGAATVALLIIVGVIVAAIALHLIAIVASLRKIIGTLTSVRAGVQAIKGQTDPLGTVMAGLAGDVSAIDDDLEGLLVLVNEAQGADDPPTPPPVDIAPPQDEHLEAARTMREAVARARAGTRA